MKEVEHEFQLEQILGEHTKMKTVSVVTPLFRDSLSSL